MQGGVAAEAAREAIVHLDGATGKVLGQPAIRDLTATHNLTCKPSAPPPR